MQELERTDLDFVQFTLSLSVEVVVGVLGMGELIHKIMYR